MRLGFWGKFKMRTILQQSNLDLLRETEQLRTVIQSRFAQGSKDQLAPELVSYHEMIVKACDRIHGRVTSNLNDLNLAQDNILDDVLNETQENTWLFHLYNQRLVSPLLRYRESDRLCLKLLSWLHKQHTKTQTIPVGLSDGEFGIWPAPEFPIVYFMPSSAQYGLLYLPLFFHEFGHLLYACHKQEMDDLVRELQKKIAELLAPAVQKDDPYSTAEAVLRNRIVETWYGWIQEVFCDSVGFRIGGKSFIHAFSMYSQMLGNEEFHVPQEQLAYRDHPVTWLRIHVLSDQMRQASLLQEANKLEETWKTIAETLNIQEDYFGYYDNSFLPFIRQTINDMLVEANPCRFTVDDISGQKPLSPQSSPVHLLNHAWAAFLREPSQYSDWQKPFMTTWQGN
jgi:hypothetical protein